MDGRTYKKGGDFVKDVDNFTRRLALLVLLGRHVLGDFGRAIRLSVIPNHVLFGFWRRNALQNSVKG